MPGTKFIDVDKIFAEKAPSIKKWLPKFIMRWLKRKLHEEEINKIMFDLKDAKV
jgi:hypothetical protein